MQCHYAKSFVGVCVSFVLLSYSAAWAVLRCCHDEDQLDPDVSVVNAEMLGTGFNAFTVNFELTQIDCLDFDYNIELLAGPTAPPQFHQLTTAATPYLNQLVGPKSRAGGLKTSFSGFTLNRDSPRTELLPPPLYLSLSNLRI